MLVQVYAKSPAVNSAQESEETSNAFSAFLPLQDWGMLGCSSEATLMELLVRVCISHGVHQQAVDKQEHVHSCRGNMC